MAKQTVIEGEPGSVWVNNTGRVLYQFVASMNNTCGACLQYHMAIGTWWGIPLHYHCRCQQFPIRPGTAAPHAFADFRELLDGMSYTDQMTAIGASNYALLKKGVVAWEEIVTKYRVRTLREVIALNKVSLKTAIKAGVPKRAYVAWGTGGAGAAGQAGVNAPAAVVIREERAARIESIRAAGVSQEALVDALSREVTKTTRLIAPGIDQKMSDFVSRRGGDKLSAELAAIAARHAHLAMLPEHATVELRQTATSVTIELPDGTIHVIGPGGSAFGRTYEQLRQLGSGKHVF